MAIRDAYNRVERSQGRDIAAIVGDISAIEIAPPRPGELVSKLEPLLDVARQASGAHYASFYLWSGGQLGLVTRRGEVPEVARCAPADCSLLDRVRHSGETVRIARLSGGVAPEHGLTCWQVQGQASILAAPVTGEDGQSLGVIELVSTADCGADGPFPDYVEPLARSLAGQAAAAILTMQLRMQLREAQFETVFRLSAAAESRDTETAAHIHRMSRYSTLIAETMGLDEQTVELVRFASPMHDIGKMGIPDSILFKPGALSDSEWHVMRQHPRIGADILSGPGSPLVVASRESAMAHHEKIDGSGYPFGLAGEEIPLIGRIVALGDAFDAITSRRCYKQAETLERGIEVVRKDAGTHFDPDCVAALETGFERAVEIREAFTSPDEEAA